MTIAVLGGGAAVLMAAATILEMDPEARILLVERNDRLGKKVLMTGGGRCNVTTGLDDIQAILSRYPRGGKFFASALRRFPPEAVRAWFEMHGVPLKIEKDGRVFPKSDRGGDVVRVFERLFESSRIRLFLNTSVSRVKKQGGIFRIFFEEQQEPLQADKLILVTGGQAYRHTGSTGDGYAFADSLGHTITKLAPSLSALLTRETWPTSISGLSFPKVRLMARDNKSLSSIGPFLFTHKGISGPAVFALSSLTAFETYSARQPMKVSIDFFPDFSQEKIREEIQKNITFNPKRSFVNALAGIVPKSLSEICLREVALPGDRHAGEIGKKEMARCATWLKGALLSVVGRVAGDEFVTAGGVDLKEINPITMESKICSGLFIAGELLDIDGFTGGFNLQACWATGRAAGGGAVL